MCSYQGCKNPVFYNKYIINNSIILSKEITEGQIYRAIFPVVGDLLDYCNNSIT